MMVVVVEHECIWRTVGVSGKGKRKGKVTEGEDNGSSLHIYS
jgi:hypothetical protein